MIFLAVILLSILTLPEFMGQKLTPKHCCMMIWFSMMFALENILSVSNLAQVEIYLFKLYLLNVKAFIANCVAVSI